MHYVLLIAVVVVVGSGSVRHEIGFVVLVVGVRQFEMAARVPCILALQPGTIAIEMIVVGVALAGAEEVAATTCQGQLVGGAESQPFLDVVSLLPIEAAEVGVVDQHRFVVGQALHLLHQFQGYLL